MVPFTALLELYPPETSQLDTLEMPCWKGNVGPAFGWLIDQATSAGFQMNKNTKLMVRPGSNGCVAPVYCMVDDVGAWYTMWWMTWRALVHHVVDNAASTDSPIHHVVDQHRFMRMHLYKTRTAVGQRAR